MANPPDRRAKRAACGSRSEATEAGRELEGVILAVGHWGVRWLVPEARPSDLDPEGLMVWISRHVMLTELPTTRVVIRFDLRARRRRSFWLVLRAGEVSLCPEHPGFPEDIVIASTPTQLYLLVVGKQNLRQAIDEGAVEVDGPPRLVRSLPRWFLLRSSGPPAVAPSLA